MSGFDNGTLQQGVFAQTKQFGAILRGVGPPAAAAGVLGDLYIDTQTYFLYARREQVATDPWGPYLFLVSVTYRNSLKWFSTYLPGNNVGADGDYCLLWGGYNNYGMQPSIFGPRAGGSWPESGDGPTTLLDPAYAGYELPAGLSDEGSPVAFSASSQLIVAGTQDEYVLALPVAQIPNSLIYPLGLSTPPGSVVVDLNPLYAADVQHLV